MDNYLLLPRALASAVYYACFALVLGGVFARLWLGTETHLATLRRVMILSAACLALLLPVQLWLMTATMLSTVSQSAVRAMLPEVLTGTHAGRVLIPDMVLALLLLLAIVLKPVWRRRAGTWVALALMLLLSAMRSASGHASSDGDFTLRETVQLVHLFCIAVWAGSVMVAGWVVLPGMGRSGSLMEMTGFGRKLSASATVAVVLVGLSGIYNGWQGLGGRDGVHWNALVGSQWGWLLTAKTVLVCCALLLGAANRWLLRGSGPLSVPDRRRFLRCMRWEAVAMAAILLVTGVLANSPPATGQ